METEDFTDPLGKRIDRMTATKQVLDQFLESRRGDRVGMVVFGNGAFVQVPFTQDLEVCRELLADLEPRMAGPKTALGDAIGLSINLFDRSEMESKVLIAMTDGNDTGSRVPPVEAAKIAAGKGILIHTIGVGDPEAAGEQTLDEKTLKVVAAVTGGQFFRAEDRDALQAVYEKLDAMDTRKVETISHRPKLALYPIPLAISLLLTVGYQLLAMIWVLLGRHRCPRSRSQVRSFICLTVRGRGSHHKKDRIGFSQCHYVSWVRGERSRRGGDQWIIGQAVLAW